MLLRREEADAAADALQNTFLGQMDAEALQRWSVAFDGPPEMQATPRLLAGQTVAVARDAAFCFIYAANLDTLRELGAQLAFFSPLANEPVPACDAVWLPGGYPELHTHALANSQTCRDSMKAHVAQGRPLWAECGGMMALTEVLELADGSQHRMAGLLPGRGRRDGHRAVQDLQAELHRVLLRGQDRKSVV